MLTTNMYIIIQIALIALIAIVSYIKLTKVKGDKKSERFAIDATKIGTTFKSVQTKVIMTNVYFPNKIRAIISSGDRLYLK